MAGMLLLGASACRRSTVTLSPETPLLESPDVTARVLGVAGDWRVVPALDARRVHIENNPVLQGRWHPLMVYTDMVRISLGEKGSAWVSEELLFDASSATIAPRTIPRQHYMYLTAAALLGMALLLLHGRHRGYLRALARGGPDPVPPGTCAFAVVSALGVYYVLLFTVLFLAGNTTTLPTNELTYFQIAQDILHGRWREPRTLTIGVAPLYIPLILLTGATTYYDILTPAVLANSMVLCPATFVLAFLILLRLDVSVRTAAVVVLLWITLPFVYYPLEYHGTRVFKAVFDLPDFGAASYRTCLPARQRRWALTLIAGNALLISPCFRLTPPFQFGLHDVAWGCTLVAWLNIFVPAISVVVLATAFRPWRQALFPASFLVLFQAGSGWLPLVMLTAVLAWVVWRWLAHVYTGLTIGRTAARGP